MASCLLLIGIAVPIATFAKSAAPEPHNTIASTSHVAALASSGGFSFSTTTDTQCSPGVATPITPPLTIGDHVVGHIGFTTAPGVDPAEEGPEAETLLVSDTKGSFSKVIGFISGAASFALDVFTGGDVLTACVQGGSGDEIGTVSGTVTFPSDISKLKLNFDDKLQPPSAQFKDKRKAELPPIIVKGAHFFASPAGQCTLELVLITATAVAPFISPLTVTLVGIVNAGVTSYAVYQDVRSGRFLLIPFEFIGHSCVELIFGPIQVPVQHVPPITA